MQPAADVVAGRPVAMDHLVVAAAAAEIACPARAAGLLPMDVARLEPFGLAVAVDALASEPIAPSSSPTKRWQADSSPSAETPR